MNTLNRLLFILFNPQLPSKTTTFNHLPSNFHSTRRISSFPVHPFQKFTPCPWIFYPRIRIISLIPSLADKSKYTVNTISHMNAYHSFNLGSGQVPLWRKRRSVLQDPRCVRCSQLPRFASIVSRRFRQLSARSEALRHASLLRSAFACVLKVTRV